MKSKSKITILVICLGLLWAMAANATQVNPPQSGFGVTGFIQEATVANVGTAPLSDPRLRGGYLTVNGIKMIVPNNSIVQMPAAALTWADLFDPAVSAAVPSGRISIRPGQSGLALADNPLQGTRPITAAGSTGYPSFMVSAVGNITTDALTGEQKYIIGLIAPIEQQVLHNGAGLINYIDHAGTVLPGKIPGRFRVGGIPNDPNTGTLCEINDPVGRWGAVHSPDPRFTTDTSWPTVSTATGYPVGIPLVAPPASDPDRPLINRPLNPIIGDPNHDPFLTAGSPLRTFTMNIAGVGQNCDPTKQVPLMVGDWIDYAGTMYKINPLGPNTAANMWISVHTLTAHMGIKTAPGSNPAYIRVEEFLFGVGDRVGGPTVQAGDLPWPAPPAQTIVQETSSRVAMISFTTNSDPNGLNLPGGNIYGIYVDPANGAETPIAFPNGNPTNVIIDTPDRDRGRLRWTTSNNGNTAGILANASGPGNFYREYIVKLTSGQGQLPPQAGTLPGVEGLRYGEYRLPIFEYLFGEGTIFGQPVPPFNFLDLGFLSGDFFDGMPVGALDPHPGGPPKGTPAIP